MIGIKMRKSDRARRVASQIHGCETFERCEFRLGWTVGRSTVKGDGARTVTTRFVFRCAAKSTAIHTTETKNLRSRERLLRSGTFRGVLVGVLISIVGNSSSEDLQSICVYRTT